MKRVISISVIVLLVLAAAGLMVKPADSASVSKEQETLELMRDIQTLNLVNSLNLSTRQMNELIKINREVAQIEGNVKSMHSRNSAEAVNVLKKMKKQLMTSNDVSDDLKKQYHQLTSPVKEKQADNRERLFELGTRAYNLLTENQKVLLSEYQPCIVPVRNIANPERIGQSGGGERFQRLLTRVRQVPADRYPQVKERILSRAQEKIRIHVRDKGEREQMLKNMADSMDHVRTLSDNEFELKKAEIAENIMPNLNKGNNQMGRNGLKKKDQFYVRRFLLNPGIIGILQKKVAMTK